MKKIGFILIILLNLGASCNKENTSSCHHYLTIKNNSDLTIYAHGSHDYPDTMGFIKRFPNPLLNSHMYRIPPHSINTNAVTEYDNCMELNIKNAPSHILMVYLFREDSLQQNPWEEAPGFVLKRYDLTISDLDAMNWTINYP